MTFFKYNFFINLQGITMKTDVEKSITKVRKRLKKTNKSEQIMLTKLREVLKKLKKDLQDEQISKA